MTTQLDHRVCEGIGMCGATADDDAETCPVCALRLRG